VPNRSLQGIVTALVTPFREDERIDYGAWQILIDRQIAAGVDGVFLEVHDNPKEAKSDGANALESTKLREVLKELLAVRKALDVARATP